MFSAMKSVVGNKNQQEKENCFVGYIDIFSYKRVKKLKSSALVIYTVHSVPFDFSSRF